jgi:hypothetical protein
VPRNLQTTVSSEYQALSKWAQNSRISDRGRSWWISSEFCESTCQDSLPLFFVFRFIMQTQKMR